MKIEKLTENKIRITLNLEDLDQNNIDLHSFMANSPESQDLFYTMLEKAEKEIGFNTKNYKLMIEAIAIPEGNFILTVTRIKQDSVSTPKKIKAKRKSTEIQSETLVYKFKNFDNFCEFGNYLESNASAIIKKLKKSQLYTYKSNYYFVINNPTINLEQLKTLHYMLLEFSEFIHNGKIFKSTLDEYGKLLIKQNPLIILNKYFIK